MRVLGSDLNRDFKKSLSEVEQAVTAGKNLSKESADAFAVEFEKLGEKGTLEESNGGQPPYIQGRPASGWRFVGDRPSEVFHRRKVLSTRLVKIS